MERPRLAVLLDENLAGALDGLGAYSTLFTHAND